MPTKKSKTVEVEVVQPTTEAATCLYPGCNNKVATRGLCANHYRVASNEVKAGNTTWETLEAAGLASHKRDRGGNAAEVFRNAGK